MDHSRFDSWTKQLGRRPVVAMLGTTTIALFGAGAPIASWAKRRKRKRKRRCGKRQVRCGKKCRRKGTGECCSRRLNLWCPQGSECCPAIGAFPNPACAPVGEFCCPQGFTCPIGTACCPANAVFPNGYCITLGNICCPTGGPCPVGFTCCPPTPTFPTGACAAPGDPCPLV